MMKIEKIDDKYYGKVLSDQDLVILFKRPQGANDAKCESFSKDLLDIIKVGDEDLFSSDIVNRTEWNDDVIETIGKFLYIHSGESIITSEGLILVCSRDYDELKEGDKQIALIRTALPNKKHWKKISIAVPILCLFLIVRCFSNHLEENRVNSNQELYSNNLEAIYSLRDEFQKAISDSHPYALYISESGKRCIADQLDSLLEIANSNIKKVCEHGNYSPVIVDVRTYETAIHQLVEEAKRTLENGRVEKNRRNYEKDVQTIKLLEDALSDAQNNQVYSSYVLDSQIQNVKVVLDSLAKVSESLFNAVEDSGNYNSLSIDSVGIRDQIQAITESAKEEYEMKNKRRRTELTFVRPQGNAVPSPPKSNELNRYDDFVKLADKDYNNYYKTRDVAAAKRAIDNYSKALTIKNSSSIVERRNKLKKELGL